MKHNCVAIASILLMHLGASLGLAAEDDIKLERVFGPEIPGRYKHPSSITELDGGDLYLVYYGGEGEYEGDTAVYGSRRKNGETAWSIPKKIADTPFRSEGNGVIWQSPEGPVWLFYVNRYGDTWSSSRIKAKVSNDGAHTWSDSITIAMDEGMMVRSHPVSLGGGDHLLPIYHETGGDREEVGADTTSLFLIYDAQQHTWTETNKIYSRIGNLQPALAKITEDYFVSYSRRGGGYEGRKDGFIVRSESRDGGRTWSQGVETDFPNPNSAVDFIKLQSGNLLLVYNDSFEGRSPLTVAISTDDDKSYPHKRNIIEGRGSFAYPTAIQLEDGAIVVVFTSDRRTVVNMATFREEAVLRPPDD